MTTETTVAVEYLALDALIPYVRNSRTHSDDQVAQLAGSIKEFGFTNPVLIDSENELIAGHGRVLAARKLGLLQIPCIRLGYLSETQKRALVIADNRIALNAGWDWEMLSVEMDELRDDGFDVGLLGMSDEDLAQLIGNPGSGLGSEDAKMAAGSLAATFMVPPFSVLNAREGTWTDRKRAWIGLGSREFARHCFDMLRKSMTTIYGPGSYTEGETRRAFMDVDRIKAAGGKV